MENKRQKIAEIITHTHKTPLEQADEILLLFSVSGQSEQSNCVHLYEHILTVKDLKYKCKCCGHEKWEQLD